MSSNNTWNSITLSGAPDGIVDELPDLELNDGNGWAENYEYTFDKPTRVAGSYSVDGWSSYHSDEVEIWAKEFTAAHPEATITWFEEWTADDVGYGTDVYRAGERVRAESTISREVPLDLGDMLDQAKAALRGFASPDPLMSMSEHYAHHAPEIRAALEKLVKGLDS